MHFFKWQADRAFQLEKCKHASRLFYDLFTCGSIMNFKHNIFVNRFLYSELNSVIQVDIMTAV